MTTLISCVGDTDPIRENHDGPLLHIARVMKPDKILMIHSERSIKKHDNMVTALNSISGYTPRIEVSERIIKDTEVYIFDKVFNILEELLHKYEQTEDEIFLNLSSATPQVKSAMFTLNRLAGLNVRAFQVTTPKRGSNEGESHSNDEPIELLIARNLDNTPNFENRVIEDSGRKLLLALKKKTYRDLLINYGYEALYGLISKDTELKKSNRGKLKINLEGVVQSVKTQKLLPDVANLSIADEQKKLLNAWLLLNLQAKRGMVGEYLIRLKNIAEYSAELYLQKNYPNTIRFEDGKPYLVEPEGELADYLNKCLEADGRHVANFEYAYLNLNYYKDIVRYYDENDPLGEVLEKIKGMSKQRNKFAHGLEEFDKLRNNSIFKYTNQTFEMVKSSIDLSDEEWAKFADLEKKVKMHNGKTEYLKTIYESYFDRLNEKLLEFLK